jgi:ABC-type antimicrobial peptide transport system permease subunit
MKRNKGVSFINIIGLALGMSVCLFTIQLAHFFYSFDDFHTDVDRIHLIQTTRMRKDGRITKFSSAPGPLLQVLKDECPDIEHVIPFKKLQGQSANFENRTFLTTASYAGQDFFNIFNFRILTGNPATLLTEPKTVVITESLAKKLFENINPIGKTLLLSDVGDLIISGVVQDIPFNSHFHVPEYEMFISFKTLMVAESGGDNNNLQSWDAVDCYIFVKLYENRNIKNFNKMLNMVTEGKYHYEGYKYSFSTIAMNKIMSEQYDYSRSFGLGIPNYIIFILAILTISVLVIACFNYTNLSIAKSLKSLKEIGVRKVVGASRFQLFFQFIYEAMCLAILAFIFALIFHRVISDAFINLYPELTLKLIKFTDSMTVYLFFIMFTFITGLIAGLFPALYLSKLKPIKIINKNFPVRIFSGFTIKKVLLVSQLTLSLIFMISTVCYFRQIEYANRFDLGFEPDNIVNVKIDHTDIPLFTQKISNSPYVTGLSSSAYVLGVGDSKRMWTYKIDRSDSLYMTDVSVDQHFLKNLGIRIIAGTDFPESVNSGNENFVLVNETALKKLGFHNAVEAISQAIQFKRGNIVQIIGVVKDFVTLRYIATTRATVIRCIPQNLKYMNIKLNPISEKEGIEFLKKTWRALFPRKVFEYKFYRDALKDAKIRFDLPLKMAGFIALLAILLNSLGFLGIAMYEAFTKTKEIGIRKIVGASEFQIIKVLSKGYAKLFIFAMIIAAPIAWFANSSLLQNVANKEEFGFTEVFVGTLIIFMIWAMNILSQTVKSSLANPVELLKCE